jgi:hypothetical protein
MDKFYDLNNFKVGDVVDIDNIPEYQGVTIERISDGGVTISGKSVKDLVISGKSPARYAIFKTKENMSDTNPVTETTTPKVRGKYTDAMNSPKLPDGEFTIKQVAELNGIPMPYATKLVGEKCVEAGVAPKAAGQRGRTAKLYKAKV